MKRSLALYLILAVAVAAILISSTFRQILFSLLFGWLTYLFSVLPNVEVRWDGVAFFMVAIAVLGLVLHRIARWLRRESAEQVSPWSLRATGLVLGIVIVVFVAGIAMVGITHQAYWLMRNDRDLLVPTLPGGESYSKNNIKQIHFAFLNSLDAGDLDSSQSLDEQPAKHSWITYALPYAGFTTEINRKLPWDHEENREETQKLVPYLLNPAITPVVLRDEDGYGVSHYSRNSKLFGTNEILRLRRSTDGKSNTLVIGEVNANFQPWAKPDVDRDPALGINRSPDGFGGSTSAEGAHFSMADGSVRFFSNDTDPEVLRALSTISDEE